MAIVAKKSIPSLIPVFVFLKMEFENFLLNSFIALIKIHHDEKIYT
jgi:hypothetical protein